MGEVEKFKDSNKTLEEGAGGRPVLTENGAAREKPPAVPIQVIRRRVLSLAGPVIGENFLQTLLGIIDTLLVAQLGAAALAGVGAALQVMMFLIATLSALSVGSAVLVAQAVGARDFRRASRMARQSLLWSLALSVPLAGAGLVLSPHIMAIFGLEPEVARIGVEYLQVTMGTVVVLVALLIGGGVLRGAGDSRTPMLVTAIANVINVALTYSLIFGHFGMPALGAVGSAWGTFLSRTLALVLMIGVLWQGRNGVSIRGRRSWRPDIRTAVQVLRIGVPAALEQFLISAAFMVLTIIVAHLGTQTLAAQRIAFNALSLAFLPGMGFGIAATALVGQSVGARRIEEGAMVTRIATSWAVGWMGGLGVIFLVFAPQIMRFFTDDPELIAIGARGLRVLALAQPFWAVLMVQSGAMRGTGNTQFPLLVNASAIWGAVGLAYVVVNVGGGGLAAAWATFLTTAPIAATILWRRFRKTVLQFQYEGVVSESGV